MINTAETAFLAASNAAPPSITPTHSYGYAAAGQLTRITDNALGKITTYAWDLAGHELREKTLQAGIVYQDNHMAYDALGRLRWVDDTRAYVNIEYDKMGNRVHIQTHVINGDTSNDGNRYFQYDAMNRQTVVDAVDAAGNLGAQGHRITYDGNGNRTSDTYQAGAALTSETYSYDSLNRLGSVTRDGVLREQRYYDGAGRAVQTGTGTSGTDIRIHRFDANGRLVHQKVLISSTLQMIDSSGCPRWGGQLVRVR